MAKPAKTCIYCGEDCAGQRRGRDRRHRYFHLACRAAHADPSSRVCARCGESCVGLPRVRTPEGRYFHRECFRAQRSRRGARLASVTTEPATDNAGRSSRSNGAPPATGIRPVRRAGSAPEGPPPRDRRGDEDDGTSIDATTEVDAGGRDVEWRPPFERPGQATPRAEPAEATVRAQELMDFLGVWSERRR